MERIFSNGIKSIPLGDQFLLSGIVLGDNVLYSGVWEHIEIGRAEKDFFLNGVKSIPFGEQFLLSGFELWDNVPFTCSGVLRVP